MIQPVFYPDTYDELLKFVSEEEILFHYFGYFDSDHWYMSPFRFENKPSFIISYYKGRWVWRDFGIDNRPQNAVAFVMNLFELSFGDAMNKIYEEIVLGYESKAPVFKPVPAEVKKKVFCKIWEMNRKELNYWNQRGIDQDACKYYNIYGGTCFNDDKLVLSGYVYMFDKEKRIWKGYDPNEKKLKFFSHNISNHIQNYNELDKTHNFWGKEYNKKVLFVKKANKDAIEINKLGFHAIAPHTETMFLAPWDIDFLKERFPYIYVFYDNDKTGINRCTDFTNQNKLLYMNVPNKFKPLKDPDDIVVHHGYNLLEDIIMEKFERDQIILK